MRVLLLDRPRAAILLLIRLVVLRLLGSAAAAARAAPGAGPGAPQERIGGALVRDPQVRHLHAQGRAPSQSGRGDDAQILLFDAKCRDDHERPHQSLTSMTDRTS